MVVRADAVVMAEGNTVDAMIAWRRGTPESKT
jgi:hypothetical protein